MTTIWHIYCQSSKRQQFSGSKVRFFPAQRKSKFDRRSPGKTVPTCHPNNRVTLIEMPDHSETQIPQVKKVDAAVSEKINQIIIER